MGAAAAWCAACPGAPARAADWDAPLRLGNGGAFGSLFLEVTAADARAPPGPEGELRWTAANEWGAPLVLSRGGARAVLRVDEQSDALSAWLRAPWSLLLGPGPAAGGRPLWERISTSVEARAVEHWGGWTDRPIEAWHRLIGSETFRRPLYPRDAVGVALLDPDAGRGIDLRSPRLALGDLAVRTQVLAAEGGASASDPARARWAVSARLDAKAPLGSPGRLGGSGGWDAGAGALCTAELAPWATAHLLASAARVAGLSAQVPLRPRAWRFAAEVSLALRLGAFTLLLEDRVATAVFAGGWIPADGAPGLGASGYYAAFLPQNRIAAGLRRGGLTFWLSEDFTPGAAPYAGGGSNWFYDSNAPDLAFGLAWARPL